jgi:hypothetical protein
MKSSPGKTDAEKGDSARGRWGVHRICVPALPRVSVYTDLLSPGGSNNGNGSYRFRSIDNAAGPTTVSCMVDGACRGCHNGLMNYMPFQDLDSPLTREACGPRIWSGISPGVEMREGY